MDLSVSICTYNRAPLLEKALAALAEADHPEGEWELLLVDNNSTDATAEVAAAFCDQLPLRYLVEKKQGLSHGRNRACAECRSELLVFSDDDVRVTRRWLSSYEEGRRAFPSADYFGGRVLPDWSAGRPRWLEDEDLALLSGLIVKYDQGPKTTELGANDPLPFGASFGLRRRLFERLEPFRPDLGPIGNRPGRGDDVEYLGRARDEGASGVYLGEAVSYHWVDPERFTLSYLYRFGVEKGLAHARMGRAGAESGSSSRAAIYLLRGLVQLAKGRGDRFRQCVINMGIQAGLKRAAAGTPEP